MKTDYQDFLLSVANAADRAGSAGVRRRFILKYRDSFPSYSPSDLHAHQMYYREIREWWSTKLKELPIEEPDEEFGLHVVVLRHKLRVIWLLASSGAGELAVLNRIDQLNTAYYRAYRLASELPHEVWRQHLLGACSSLRGQHEKLRVCANTACEQATMYFFREFNRSKYCSVTCSQAAANFRRKEHLKNMPPKEFKRSKEARDRMSQSARVRWERVRKTIGLRRGEHRADNESKDSGAE